MSVSSLLLPLFMQVALTFGLMAWMGFLRVRAVQLRTVRPKDIALRQPNWPERTTQIANCFHNQLEVPLLFYVVVALILITRTNSDLFVILAWVYVITRFVHAFIHTGSNQLDKRFFAMLASVVVLGAMWVVFAVRILTSEGV